MKDKMDKQRKIKSDIRKLGKKLDVATKYDSIMKEIFIYPNEIKNITDNVKQIDTINTKLIEKIYQREMNG